MLMFLHIFFQDDQEDAVEEVGCVLFSTNKHGVTVLYLKMTLSIVKRWNFQATVTSVAVKFWKFGKQ